jgi:hypothetical protein
MLPETTIKTITKLIASKAGSCTANCQGLVKSAGKAGNGIRRPG